MGDSDLDPLRRQLATYSVIFREEFLRLVRGDTEMD